MPIQSDVVIEFRQGARYVVTKGGASLGRWVSVGDGGALVWKRKRLLAGDVVVYNGRSAGDGGGPLCDVFTGRDWHLGVFLLETIRG
jgi:hypothetical protein